MVISNPLHPVTSQLIQPAVFCGEMPSHTCALGVISVPDCMAVIMTVRAVVWMDYFERT